MNKLLLGTQLLLSPLSLIASNQIFEAGSMVRIADTLAMSSVESSGNTDLLEDSSGYYAGSASTPLVSNGSQVSSSTFNGYTALGVDLVNGAYYRLVLYNGSRYYAASFSQSGSRTSNWTLVSNANLLLEEVNLQQDLNGDGYIGWPPPASIVGMQFEYTSPVSSVPSQEFYGSDGLAAYGFSNSIIGRISYTYSDGVISFPEWNEEIRLTFNSANSGTYSLFEGVGPGEYLDDSGTFSIVTTSSLEDKTDWQHTETFDSGFSTDYWNISHDLEDRVEVASGALNFIFAGADEEGEEDEDEEGEEDEYDDYEIDLDYGRALPMDENWQIVMDDVYASNSLEGFEFELELEFEGQGSSFFQCGFEFENNWELGGSGNRIDVFYNSTTQQGIDINGDGVIQTVPYAMDLDGDGFLDYGIEVDYDGDGNLDVAEDLDYDGFLDVAEDLNNDGILNNGGTGGPLFPGGAPALLPDEGALLDEVADGFDYNGDGLIFGFFNEDVDGDGQLGLFNEDVDGDGNLDYNEDLDGDGRFDIWDESNIDENVTSYHSGDASVSTVEDSRIQSNVSLRITHNANSRELVFEYRPDGVNEWSELARLNLGSGDFSGLNSLPTQGYGELIGTSQRMELYLEVEGEETTQVGDLKIGGIEIGAYTPPEPTQEIEDYGNTYLLEGSSGYYAGSVYTPLVYNGSQFSSSTLNGYSALGVDLVNGAYRLVLSNGSSYRTANFSLSGSNISNIGSVNNILTEEVNLQQDLDGDGHVGTPPIGPPTSIAGMQFEYTSTNAYTSVPYQEFYGSDDLAAYGFSNSIIGRSPYTYSNGVINFQDINQSQEEIRLTFNSANSGTYSLFEGVGPGEYLDDSGTFSIVTTSSLEDKTDWQHTETFDSGFSTDYWNISHDLEDRVEVANGALNFIFAAWQGEEDLNGDGLFNTGGYVDYETIIMDLDYGRALPMDENWQIVMDDVYASSSLEGFEFDLDLEFEGQDSRFKCGFEFGDELGGYFISEFYTQSSVDIPTGVDGGFNVSLRITHNANSRELVFEYQPNGANAWSELARLNLGSGDFSGLDSPAHQGNGELIGTSQRMEHDLIIKAYVATQVGDLRIGGIEIGNYTPPPTPVDSDDDGLDDSVETNTGTYVSPTDTGTNPQLKDSSGDGFTDGEIVSAGYDPNISYREFLNFFGLVDPRILIDAQLGQLGLERGADGNFDMNFDLEMSTDLETWTPHTSHSLELTVPDQSKTFMRLNIK